MGSRIDPGLVRHTNRAWIQDPSHTLDPGLTQVWRGTAIEPGPKIHSHTLDPRLTQFWRGTAIEPGSKIHLTYWDPGLVHDWVNPGSSKSYPVPRTGRIMAAGYPVSRFGRRSSSQPWQSWIFLQIQAGIQGWSMIGYNVATGSRQD